MDIINILHRAEGVGPSYKINGARFCFEDLMEELLRKENPSRNVKGVRLAQGDGGIDVFVGNIGQEKIDVYQCKYFDAGLRSSQWQQITDSYNRAIVIVRRGLTLLQNSFNKEKYVNSLARV